MGSRGCWAFLARVSDLFWAWGFEDYGVPGPRAPRGCWGFRRPEAPPPLAGQSRLCDTGLLLVSIKLSPKETLTNIQTELSVEFHPNGTVL